MMVTYHLSSEKNNIGPSTVPWGTPMVKCRCSVLMLSTTTRFFLLLVKLMSQFRICGLISTSSSLRTKILWDTESNALLKLKEKIHTKSAFPSILLSQLGSDFCDAMLELSPFRWANESRSMWLVHTVDTSFLYTSHSNRRKIIFVREIGLCWFRELSGIFFSRWSNIRFLP